MGRRRSVSSAGFSSAVPWGQYLSPAGLQQLRAYKYVSAPLSSIVDQKMTYFWEFVVNLMPMWLAPNLITTFSFMHAWFAHLLLTWYSPSLVEQAPRWAYVAVALAMFMYQTLDAIDGKQARRTKNGSPLGQLFDHGCDAVTAWIMGIFVAATVQAGPSLMSYVFLHMIVVPFFAANWEESCTSVFRFGVVGVTEGQFLVMGVELLTGLIGPDLWTWRVGELMGHPKLMPWLTVHDAVVIAACCGGAYQLVSSVVEVCRYYRAHPTESREQAITSFVEFFTVVLLGGAWVMAPSGVMQLHPRCLLLVVGALCSYQASRLIICHTTGEYYSRAWAILWPFPLLVLNEWSGRLFNGSDSALWVNSTAAMYGYALYVAALYVHFVVVTIDQITSFLGIRCFVIKPKVDEPPALADPKSEDPKRPHIIRKVFGKVA